MKTIIVGTDGTTSSGAAVAAASDLAVDAGAVVHLVTACAMPVVAAGMDVVAMPSHHEVRAALGEAVEGQAESVRRRGIQVEVHVCDGSPAQVLCDVAETVGADVIVVGNRRMKGAGRVLGAVASKVARKAPCSVFIAKTTG
jgi:nucleotide-binding universal stress UspA family protein